MPGSADPFMIRAHVPDWEASVADYRAASTDTRSRLPCRPDVAYGSHADETLDLFFPADPTAGRLPVHMFIHGGYWRAFSKRDYSFVADTITATGAIAALIDYSLMPAVRMATLVGQVRRAAAWIVENASSFGGDPAAMSASGHSAGAHLASYLVRRSADEPAIALAPVRSVLLLSGLYDLAPLARSFLQAEIGLTPDEVAGWSPMRTVSVGSGRVTIAVGGNETQPFLEQAEQFAALIGGDSPVRPTLLAGEDHMSVIRSLGFAGRPAAALLEATIASSR